MINRDLFNTASPRRVANCTMQIVDTTQRGYQPHEQLHAMAIAFLMVCDHWGMPAQDVFSAAKNLLNDQDNKRPEFSAVEQYIANEL